MLAKVAFKARMGMAPSYPSEDLTPYQPARRLRAVRPFWLFPSQSLKLMVIKAATKLVLFFLITS